MNKKKKVGKKYAFEREVYKNVARVRVQRFTGVVGNVSKKGDLTRRGQRKEDGVTTLRKYQWLFLILFVYSEY